MQQITACLRCGQPVPAGAAFCPTCGMPAQMPKGEAAQVVAQAPTQRAATPAPLAGDNAPTQLAPPPPPEATLRADAAPVSDPYAAQYQAPPAPAAGAPPFSQYGRPGSGPPPPGPYPAQRAPQAPFAPPPPPPGYAPGPPPVMASGGMVPGAQPKKKRGGRTALIILLVILLLGGALGAGAFFLLRKPTTANQGSASSTPGASATSTPGANNTPGSTPGSSGETQTLNDINRVGVYAGVVVTLLNATLSPTNDDFGVVYPDRDNILKIGATVSLDKARLGSVNIRPHALAPDGSIVSVGPGHNTPADALPLTINEGSKLTGAFYLEVPKTFKITDWVFVMGEGNELPMSIPLSGDYDPSAYQEIPHTMGLNQPIKYHNGDITGVITKVITATWNPGDQAPKGMRFLRIYLHVTNTTAIDVFVGGSATPPQYLLIYPNGDRKQANTGFNLGIAVTVKGGESKDVGFDSWTIPAEPAPYAIVFLNPDGSQAAKIDLGTV